MTPILIHGREHDVVGAIEVLAKQVLYLAELPLEDPPAEERAAEWDRLLAEARALRDAIERSIIHEHAHKLLEAKSPADRVSARCERLTYDGSLAAVDMRIGQVILAYGRAYTQRAYQLADQLEAKPSGSGPGRLH
jgi:hypothetical protein